MLSKISNVEILGNYEDVYVVKEKAGLRPDRWKLLKGVCEVNVYSSSDLTFEIYFEDLTSFYLKSDMFRSFKRIVTDKITETIQESIQEEYDSKQKV